MTTNLKNRIPKKVRDAYAIIGSFGGKATFKKKGKKGMSVLGKAGAQARWKSVDKKSQTKSSKRTIK